MSWLILLLTTLLSVATWALVRLCGRLVERR